MTSEPGNGVGNEDGIVHRCKMHEAGHRRSEANTAAWHAKWDAQNEADRHRNEVLDKIRPLLAQLGVHPQTLTVGVGVGDRNRRRSRRC